MFFAITIDLPFGASVARGKRNKEESARWKKHLIMVMMNSLHAGQSCVKYGYLLLPVFAIHFLILNFLSKHYPSMHVV